MMTTTMKVEKMGKAWTVTTATGVLAGPYDTKKTAEQKIAIAEGFAAFFRAATVVVPTTLEWALMDALREIERIRGELAREFRSLSRRAAEDADRVRDGRTPWYSAGSYARDGGELAVFTARLECAIAKFNEFRYVARDEGGDAAVGVAMYDFFRAVGS